MLLSKRKFILGGLIAAPAVIADHKLMPVKSILPIESSFILPDLSTNLSSELLEKVKSQMKESLESVYFEPNDDFTRYKIFNNLNVYMNNLLQQNEVYMYHVVCDSYNNPPDIVDKDLVCEVYIKDNNINNFTLVRAYASNVGISF